MKWLHEMVVGCCMAETLVNQSDDVFQSFPVSCCGCVVHVFLQTVLVGGTGGSVTGRVTVRAVSVVRTDSVGRAARTDGRETTVKPVNNRKTASLLYCRTFFWTAAYDYSCFLGS